ncbi:MAG: LamG domain-containing protein, partial [Planctomycetota bacterium]
PCSDMTTVDMASIEITGTGVTPVGSYEDVPVQHVMTDAELVPYVVSFITDGTGDVEVTFHPGQNGRAVLNAFLLRGGGETARSPEPINMTENVCLDDEICWTAGPSAAQHHIYLGTDFDDVNDATTASTLFMDELSLGTECYSLSGLVDWGTTYYWRIDEVNDPCLWKGDVWQFTTNDGNTYDPVPEVNELRVKVDRELSWQPGCGATAHDVYLGTSMADVTNATTASHAGVQYARVTMPTTSWDPPGDMEHFTNYYWRVDRVGGPTFKGDIWNFRTIVAPTIVRYSFDGSQGEELPSELYDDTGLGVKLTKYTIDEGLVTYGSSNPRVNTLGTSAQFAPDAGLVHIDPCGPDDFDIFRLDYEQYTYEMWVKPHSVTSDSALIWKGAGWGAYHLMLREADGDTTGLRVVGHHDPVMTTSDDSIRIGEWNHIAVVFDLPDWRVYVNSDLEDEEWRSTSLPTGNASSVGIGVQPDLSGNWFDGQIDELRLANVALGPEDFLSGSGPEYARNPNPENQAVDVDPFDPSLVLSWTPGQYAAAHDIYFGTSRDDVGEGATAVEPLWGPNTWDPPELVFDTTYYWRVDEVNDPCMWMGWAWSFTTANYITIDDFEAYDGVSNRIFDTWQDGLWNWTGSYIDLGTEDSAPVHNGSQSMEYTYDNTTKWDVLHYWSEARLPFDPARDFTEAGVTMLTLYFYGDPGNDATDTEELYVGLEGSLAEVRYSDDAGRDMDDLKRSEWTEWNIPVSDFIGVNPSAVTGLLIGFGDRDNTSQQGGEGIVYFDDIRLYPSRCVPELLKPVADLDNDCVVSWGD